jgi:peptide/nickel transport system permease protein
MAGNPGITEADKDRLRAQLGLSDPLVVQIGEYAANLLRGDLGDSLRFRSPVRPLIMEKLPPTIELTLFAMVVAILIALPLGVVTALQRDRPADYVGSIVAVLGISVPGFLLGILLILVFAVEWRLLPASGYGGSVASALKVLVTDGDPGPLKESFRFLLLPGVTLGVAVAAYNARIIRSSVVEVMRQDYLRCARAKGLPERIVFLRHAFRNALIPVVTIMGLQFAFLIAGTIVVERVFSLPGIGALVIDAVTARDVAIVRSVVLLLVAFVVLVNFVVDLVYGVIDPRLRTRAP